MTARKEDIMPVDLTELGHRLRGARSNCDLSQDAVAKALNLPRAFIIQIENGERPITLEQLDAFARLYKRPVAEFVTEQPEDLLVALLRTTPEVADQEQVEAEIMRHVTICRVGTDLERTLGLPARTGPPAYDLPAPSGTVDALDQGNYLARQERLRLGLGDNPVADMADLVSATGIWASGSRFPDEMSGIFLRHQSFGMVVLVNFLHPRTRKRFSYAHEFAHALLDREHTATISTHRNRAELLEVRANAFAASFLLPAGGVRTFMRSRRKGIQSRQETVIYDPSIEQDDEPVRATARTAPGSQKISYQDVAALARLYGASYPAAAYRMKSLGLVNERDLKELLEKQEIGREYLRLLDFHEDLESVEESPRKADRELISQVVDLAIEAYRREEIGTDRLLEIGTTLGVGGRKLVRLAEAAK
jgi:Zn-dependent peptidase ImmA (M78 family)/DNA-binding XRE family transcriptional regulator